MNDLAGNPGTAREEIVTKLKGEIAELLCLESSDGIDENTRLVEDLNVDSLGMVDLVMQVEDSFEVSLPTNSDLSRIKTIGDVVDMLTQHLKTGLNYGH
ncbi:MAG: acyl carrier protein [Methylococcaceae bacterium]|nr:acyl carrier protein [Methylococcaceae bacterium]